MSSSCDPISLPLAEVDLPEVRRDVAYRLQEDFERCRDGLPEDLRAYVVERYQLDLAGEYAGEGTRNPFGKASGQLSLNARQVRRDGEAQLGFVVLKTVIAQDAGGTQSMSEWAIPETRMAVGRIVSSRGEEGWTVTWKGRGWHGAFREYLEFFGAALEIGLESGMPIAPSVKYHLPAAGETEFRTAEYAYTTQALQEVWNHARSGPMPLEKDFSPTLAGDRRSEEREQILHWLRRVPDLIRAGARPGGPGVTVGMKLMNARFDEAFQVEMVRAAVDGPEFPPDFLVYANRLFDPEREFEGHCGVAVGGPDLSRRNLRCLTRVQNAVERGEFQQAMPPVGATGDILTGKRALQYRLLGATSCQMHTVFQLPDTEFAGRMRNKTEAVLHHLIFHPESGLIAWMDHVAQRLGRKSVSWLDDLKIG